MLEDIINDDVPRESFISASASKVPDGNFSIEPITILDPCHVAILSFCYIYFQPH